MLSTETFSNSSVPDSRWQGLGDACLTAAADDSTPSEDASNLSSCKKTVDSVTNRGEGSDGYLQLTDNSGGSSAAAILDRAFPSSAGLVVTFKQYQYAQPATGTGAGAADGIGFFLADGAYSLTKAGPTGGSLGYASINNDDGLDHGYLGVGLDVYGNFHNQPYVGKGCEPQLPFRPNAVTLRGSGNGTSGYCVADSADYSNLQNAPSTAPGGAKGELQKVTVTIAPTTADDPYPTVTVAINGTQILQSKMTTPAPATLKMGFAASTGGGHEVHMIRNVDVRTVEPLGGINLTKTVDHSDSTGTEKTVFTQGDTVPYSFVVTNPGEETLKNITVTDPKISGITCPTTELEASNSFRCTGTYGPLTAAEAAAGSFDNSATAAGIDEDNTRQTDTSSVTVPTYESAPIALTKKVTGDGADLAPADGTYTVNYSYPSGTYQPTTQDASGTDNTYPAGSGTLTVTKDDTVTSGRIPTGATVTLDETAPTAIDNATWGTPAFSQNPLTVGSDTATEVTVDNPLSLDRGSISWTKVDQGNQPLGGAEFTLTGPGGYNEDITDNGDLDADKTDGAFRVESLVRGDYALKEKTAPDGYTLSSEEKKVSLTSSNPDATVDAFVNTKVKPSPTTESPSPTPTPTTESPSPTPTPTTESPSPTPTTASPSPSETTASASPSTTTAAPAPAPTTTTSAPHSTPNKPDHGGLPRTGAEVTAALVVALLLIAAGAGAIFYSRQRRRN